ncbi:TPA: hypothetical protein MG551_19310 [Klebsiella aerogenes]|nr:hypothetical protein [Klebsiella aerogenes]
MKQTIFILGMSILPITAFSESTLISPMIGGIDICQSAIKKGIRNTYEAAKYCQSINETSSTLIEKRLSEFGPEKSKDGKFQVGYMLSFPLLSYVNMNPDGSYKIDKAKIQYRIKLLHDTKRQAVIYLFSNHFSVSEGAKTEELISKLDSKNMMQLSDKIIPVDNYFSSKTYPWAINASNSLIDKIRKDTINEVLSQLCALDIIDKQKIRAVTVLGEVHYTFPDFFNGMGYHGKMKLTDYSDNSIKRFRNYLIEKYKNINSLNDNMGSEYKSFDEITPPSKDINTTHLNNFFEHLDYASSGKCDWIKTGTGASGQNNTFHEFISLFSYSGQDVHRHTSRPARAATRWCCSDTSERFSRSRFQRSPAVPSQGHAQFLQHRSHSAGRDPDGPSQR